MDVMLRNRIWHGTTETGLDCSDNSHHLMVDILVLDIPPDSAYFIAAEFSTQACSNISG